MHMQKVLLDTLVFLSCICRRKHLTLAVTRYVPRFPQVQIGRSVL